MPMITLPSGMVTVDTHEVLSRVPIMETVAYYNPMAIYQIARPVLGNQLILSMLPTEEICDYLISRGINVEM